jgi:hypothetical protein
MSKPPKPSTRNTPSVSEMIHQPGVSKEIQVEGVAEETHSPDLSLDPVLTDKTRSRYPAVVRRHQITLFLEELSQHGNTLKACERVGITLRTMNRWQQNSMSFNKRHAEAMRIGEERTLKRYEGKIDTEALDAPFDKVTGILSMFRMKKLNPQYKDTQQVNVNVAGPAALQFVVNAQNASNPQDDTTTGGRKRRIENA